MMLQDQPSVNPTSGAIRPASSGVVPAGHHRSPRTEAPKSSVTPMSLAPVLREDIAQLWLSLGSAHCSAAIFSEHGEPRVTLAGESSIADDEQTVHRLSAPICDPVNSVTFTAEIRYGESALLRVTPEFLSSILDLTVEIISERWFRMHFRRHWVLAAQRCEGKTSQRLLMALDRDRRVVGADRPTRAALAHACRDALDRVPLSAVVSIGVSRLKVSTRDVEQLLPAADGGAPWIGLLTPPCLGTGPRWDDHRLTFQTRPRFHLLTSRSTVAATGLTSSGLAPCMLRKVLERIDAALSAPLSVQDLAAIAGISRSHFARSFLRSVGATPHDYIMQRRLEKAREFLEQSSLSLAEIALLTGFSDQSHFSRRFQRSSGFAPLRYRKLHR